MNLVDSCGWMEYFTHGQHADFYEKIILLTKSLIVPTICLTEVYKKVRRDRDENAALFAVATMQLGHVVPLTDEIAILAAELGVKHKLPLADGIILATARTCNAVVYTQDADFNELENVRMPT